MDSTMFEPAPGVKLLPRRRLLSLGAAAALALPDAARAAPSLPLGSTLDLRNATLMRKVVFSSVPAFATLLGPRKARAMNDPGFAWRAGLMSPELYHQGNRPNWSGINDTIEIGAYPNAQQIAALGRSPFIVDRGSLVIRASLLPDVVRAGLPQRLQNRLWMSGAMNTWPFSQTYGVFSLTAQASRGNPLWPAFWLLPTDMSWPPECDVFEWLGGLPTNYQFGLLSKDPAYPKPMRGSKRAEGPDWSAAPVTVTVDWGPTETRFYVGRPGEAATLMNSRPTPSDMSKPMYVTINLAIGGPNSWPALQPHYDHKPNLPMPAEPHFRLIDFAVWDRPEYRDARG